MVSCFVFISIISKISLSKEGDIFALESVLVQTAQADTKLDGVNSVKTVTQEEWALLSKTERRRLFSKHTIHVIGEPKSKVLSHIQNWEDLDGFSESFDLERPLHVHGMHFYIELKVMI